MSVRKGDRLIAGNPDLSGVQLTSNLSQTIDTSTTQYPSSNAVKTELDTKQDVLTAGTGITIENSVISSTGNVTIDGTTITTNTSGQIQANGVINQNGSIAKYDWIGTKEEYNTALTAGTIQSDWLCYVTDDDFYDVPYNWIGTQDAYDIARTAGEIPDNWVCYITDDVSTLPYSREQVDAKMTDIETVVASFESTITALQEQKATTDLDNVSTTGKTTAVQWSMPDYDSVVTCTTPYTAPSNGLLSYNLDSGSGSMTINGNTVYVGGNDSYNEGPVQIPLSSGDIATFTTSSTACFIPYKSA